jgi:hypothetical protein
MTRNRATGFSEIDQAKNSLPVLLAITSVLTIIMGLAVFFIRVVVYNFSEYFWLIPVGIGLFTMATADRLHKKSL